MAGCSSLRAGAGRGGRVAAWPGRAGGVGVGRGDAGARGTVPHAPVQAARVPGFEP
ncbi:hypothetical protein SFR_3062 [Streptomyces sp. FR-008]|nr:hypothetical protein SFR_3062 [Streptomyces sp. FR-008]